MADAYKKLYQGQAGSSAATLATVPGGATWIIRHIRVVNTHASAAQTIELWHNGTTDATKILGATSIGVDETYTEDCFIPAATGEIIAGKASTASEVTVALFGVEIT